MSEINTGMQRGTELTVTKQVGGIEVDGYPKVYKMYEAFGNYAAITVDALAKLAVDDYQARLIAFKTYVETVETGVEVNIEEAYVENLTACPLP